VYQDIGYLEVLADELIALLKELSNIEVFVVVCREV
jgi:hypothetical protein